MQEDRLKVDGGFVIFPIISVSHNEQTNERTIDRFDIGVVADTVVGVNPLDGTSQQVTEDANSIVYFESKSGLRPILSPADAAAIRAVVNQARGFV